MPHHEIDLESRQIIAGIAAFAGALIGFLFARPVGLDPVIGAIGGFFLSYALGLYSRGVGIIIVVIGALTLFLVLSGGGNA